MLARASLSVFLVCALHVQFTFAATMRSDTASASARWYAALLVLLTAISAHAGLFDAFASIQETVSIAMDNESFKAEWSAQRSQLGKLPPLVVVPGLGSSNLTFKLENAENPLGNCPTNQNW